MTLWKWNQLTCTYPDLFHVDNHRVKNNACSTAYIVNTMHRNALTCAEVGFVYSLKRLVAKGYLQKKIKRVECFIKVKTQRNKEVNSKPCNAACFF